MKSLLKLTAALGALLGTPALAETIAITNADIYTLDGAGHIPSGTLILRDGLITDVGANLPIPAGARVIDAKGQVVTPGFVAVNTALGLSEVGSDGGSRDAATGDEHLGAAFDVQYALNPQSTLIPISRLGGVTSAIVVPQYDGGGEGGGDLLFAGQAAAITLNNGPTLLLKPGVGIVLDLGEDGGDRAGGSRSSELLQLRRIFDDVKLYNQRRADYDSGSLRELRASYEDLNALAPVLQGKLPLIVSVHRSADILQALSLAKAYNLKLILTGAEEAWTVASHIAAARVPVILNPTSNLPSNFETFGATLHNAARLQAAGVQVIISGNDSGSRVRDLRYNAGIAVSRGLPYEAALKAITTTPAAAFGIEGQVGSIKVGKRADVVVWTGDPLEPLSQPSHVLINGEELPLTSRSTQLRERYLK